jgi:hypothetical protein
MDENAIKLPRSEQVRFLLTLFYFYGMPFVHGLIAFTLLLASWGRDNPASMCGITAYAVMASVHIIFLVVLVLWDKRSRRQTPTSQPLT